MKETMKNLSQDVGAPATIVAKHPLNSDEKCYHWSQLVQ
jgi:hypothetical protein